MSRVSDRAVVIHENTGVSRADRRHIVPVRFRNGVQVNYRIFVPKRFQRPATNVPYVKPKEDR